MPNLTYIEFGTQNQSGLENETLADLRARWAEKGVKVVWTIKLPRTDYTCRSDATAFSTLHQTNSKRLEGYQVAVLQYATELRALDLGHNWIFDIDWIEPLKELRVLILSDNRITDISPLADKPLEYLEMFNNRVKDVSCLEGKETLLDLNLCNTHVGDLSVLYTLPNLKRVWMGDIDELTKDTVNAYLAEKGDTLEAYNFTTKYPTEGAGARTTAMRSSRPCSLPASTSALTPSWTTARRSTCARITSIKIAAVRGSPAPPVSRKHGNSIHKETISSTPFKHDISKKEI